jgi:ERCC4-type nuclease
MIVRLLVSVKDGSGYHNPGSLLELDDDEAKRLIRIKAAVVPPEPEPKEPEPESDEELTEEELAQIMEELEPIDGVSEAIASELIDAGYQSLEAVAEANAADLEKIKGIGKKSAVTIIESAQELLED